MVYKKVSCEQTNHSLTAVPPPPPPLVTANMSLALVLSPCLVRPKQSPVSSCFFSSTMLRCFSCLDGGVWSLQHVVYPFALCEPCHCCPLVQLSIPSPYGLLPRHPALHLSQLTRASRSIVLPSSASRSLLSANPTQPIIGDQTRFFPPSMGRMHPLLCTGTP